MNLEDFFGGNGPGSLRRTGSGGVSRFTARNDGDAVKPVVCGLNGPVWSLILNRPDAINSLNFTMVQHLKRFFAQAQENDTCRLVLLYGAGGKGFCAGGDMKDIAAAVRAGKFAEALGFLRAEYDLDLMIHRHRKPVIVIADGIVMGGGLGLAAGADMVIVTERTIMAMPETRIGFFPDVGATGWLHAKCPAGYPAFIGLTGHELKGTECVRLGLGTHFVRSGNLSQAIFELEHIRMPEAASADDTLDAARSAISRFVENPDFKKTDMDVWVYLNFSRKTSAADLLDSLSRCVTDLYICREVFKRISERSPISLALTQVLLQLNEKRNIEEVFESDIRAADFIFRQHDFLEGVRARLIDKDDNPQWLPSTIGSVDISSLIL